MSQSTAITCDVCREAKADVDERHSHLTQRPRDFVGWVQLRAESLVETVPPAEEFPMPRNLPQRSLKVIGAALDVPDEIMDAAATEDVEAAGKHFQAALDAKRKPYLRHVTAKIDVCPSCSSEPTKIGMAMFEAFAKAAAEPEGQFGDTFVGIE